MGENYWGTHSNIALKYKAKECVLYFYYSTNNNNNNINNNNNNNNNNMKWNLFLQWSFDCWFYQRPIETIRL